jgi:hypothetical protein
MNVTTELVTEICWCGIPHAIPSALAEEARRTGHAVYCPLGHSWVTKSNEVERLRKELAQTRDARDRVIRQRDAEQRSHSATKGQLTRARKRAANGVCPCCHRSFAATSMARHMKTKHPEFTP